MADSRVRAAADELVLFANRYLGAPVFSDVPSRPDCKSHSCDHQQCPYHCYPFSLGKKSAIQNTETRILRIEQDESARHESDMSQTRERRLPLLLSFLIACSPDPVNAKGDPSRLNDYKWRRHRKVRHEEMNSFSFRASLCQRHTLSHRNKSVNLTPCSLRLTNLALAIQQPDA